ncbi:Cupin 2 conserved barrel domain protein [Beutenbergia cavernae DSM 12333]|uniref:Cupin 2 conserved barrel domain protein n=1 Tax=Beutenbergia cavernae (strain ATCC BAA-8 / DSM 12333 / CCUG 43141 / JCM 11478 / NBRC 16432 / NCIMB 13614 / HKI 0122) TaxID=471853 RepID=C5BX33_BEUC1|nr:cupin domain-containing protein [Beutenbergia cavernae]ACQ78708.1 Cupin 2 conserved barrel domain protein [Beutenbergia cavernae DSM 12333]
MLIVAKEADLRIGTGRTVRFEGEGYGSGISYFHVENEPGQGPDAHVHPYSETWVVLAGTAHMRTADGETLAHAGDVVVVGPDTAHAFRAAGTETLRMMCIHASPRIQQEFLADDESERLAVAF